MAGSYAVQIQSVPAERAANDAVPLSESSCSTIAPTPSR